LTYVGYKTKLTDNNIDPAVKLFPVAGSLSSALFVSGIFLYKTSSPARTHSLFFYNQVFLCKSSSSVSVQLICCVSVERHLIDERLCSFRCSLDQSDDKQINGSGLSEVFAVMTLFSTTMKVATTIHAILSYVHVLYMSCPFVAFGNKLHSILCLW